jgi:micrococcal nuclease
VSDVRYIVVLAFAVLSAVSIAAAYYLAAPQTMERLESDSHLCGGNALCISDKVTSIIDGDTVYLKNHKIRLSLVNTPEKNQPGFDDATAFTRSTCPVGSTVIVDQDDGQPYDQFGRMVAKITCDGKVLNAELLYNGHANILTQYCAVSEFSKEDWALSYGC